MGDDSYSRGRGFKTQPRILDGHDNYFTLIFCKNCIFCLERPKINKKRLEFGPFKKYRWRKNKLFFWLLVQWKKMKMNEINSFISCLRLFLNIFLLTGHPRLLFPFIFRSFQTTVGTIFTSKWSNKYAVPGFELTTSFLLTGHQRPHCPFILVFSNRIRYKCYNKLTWKMIHLVCLDSNSQPLYRQSPPLTAS